VKVGVVRWINIAAAVMWSVCAVSYCIEPSKILMAAGCGAAAAAHLWAVGAAVRVAAIVRDAERDA